MMRYWHVVSMHEFTLHISPTYTFVRAREPAIWFWWRLLSCRNIVRRLILDQQACLEWLARLLSIWDLLSVHVAAKFPYCVQFNMVQHLTELPELILRLILLLMAVLLRKHTLERIQVRTVLD